MCLQAPLSFYEYFCAIIINLTQFLLGRAPTGHPVWDTRNTSSLRTDVHSRISTILYETYNTNSTHTQLGTWNALDFASEKSGLNIWRRGWGGAERVARCGWTNREKKYIQFFPHSDFLYSERKELRVFRFVHQFGGLRLNETHRHWTIIGYNHDNRVRGKHYQYSQVLIEINVITFKVVSNLHSSLNIWPSGAPTADFNPGSLLNQHFRSCNGRCTEAAELQNRLSFPN